MVARRTAQISPARGVLYVHSAPRALCPHVEWAVGHALGRSMTLEWEDQPLLEGAQRAEYLWEGSQGMGAQIASGLRGWEYLRYEVTEDAGSGTDGGRWMYTPGLGIFHGQVDTAGNLVVSEDRIRRALSTGRADSIELYREFGRALGQEWDEELEPFRYAGDISPVVWLHKVG
jgi:hypothetical protein